MTDRPILFSGAMVRALLSGTKTQTRRGLGTLAVWKNDDGSNPSVSCLHIEGEPLPRVTIGRVVIEKKLKAAVGDRLWVKETHALVGDNPLLGDEAQACFDMRVPVYYRADDVQPELCRWRPSIFMKRRYSRLTLIVTDVRVERLQDISEQDALAEGVDRIKFPERGDWGWPQRKYREVWEAINGPGSWSANPWVGAYTFTVRRGNIDEVRP